MPYFQGFTFLLLYSARTQKLHSGHEQMFISNLIKGHLWHTDQKSEDLHSKTGVKQEMEIDLISDVSIPKGLFSSEICSQKISNRETGAG